MRVIKALTLLGSLASMLHADVIVTKDGSRLSGEITLIDKGAIHLKTSYAGTLTISQDQVESFQTESPVVVRLQSGTVMTGPVQLSSDGKLKIRSDDGVLETQTQKVAATWTPGAEDPEVARNRRAWRYDASVDLAGQSGNVEKFGVGVGLKAELKGPQDSLRFFFDYEQAEEQQLKTEDRVAGGASYESFFGEVLGWYIRTEVEMDNIDNIKFRSTSAGGLSYRLTNKDHQSLVLRSGLGYRFTDFDNTAPEESNATLDLGLAHSYEFNDIFVMRNDLTFVPAIDDFGNYRVVHDTGIEVPVGSGQNWKLRFGINNDYESEATTPEKLNTTYYSRMIYSWR